MRRALAAVLTAAVLLAMLPGAATAARSSRFTELIVVLFCDGENGSIFIDSSSEFGTTAEALAWFGDDDPLEDEPTVVGFTDAIELVEGDSAAQVGFDFTAFGTPDGEDLGDGSFTSDLTVVDTNTVPEPFPQGNQKSRVDLLQKFVEGEGTITTPLGTADVLCSGEVTHRTVRQNNPTSFVSRQSGVDLVCEWETEEFFAFLNVGESGFGLFLELLLFSADHDLVATGEFSGSVDASGIEFTAELFDGVTEELESAEISADFEPDGEPVTSIGRAQGGRIKVVEQLLTPDGTLDFSTGQSVTLDGEACDAIAFNNKTRFNGAKGPKPKGRPPVNDTLDGAIALEVGDRARARTRATAVEPELFSDNCSFGKTVWYTFEGTGDPVTIDTAKTAFDTVVAVYRVDGSDLEELACVDDVFFDPLGVTLQAAVTVDTEEGETYAIQVGGFWFSFGGDPQFGRVRLKLR